MPELVKHGKHGLRRNPPTFSSSARGGLSASGDAVAELTAAQPYSTRGRRTCLLRPLASANAVAPTRQQSGQLGGLADGERETQATV